MDTKSQTFTSSSVTSSDGTIIGYRQLGSGSGIILVHGGASASQSYMKLGALLSDTFTVYIPDRRGRGLSGPFGLSLIHISEPTRLLSISYAVFCLKKKKKKNKKITIQSNNR